MTRPVVVMGVSGSGKTTVGRAVAERLQVAFVDADDLHPQANRDKMAAGVPLEDDDRWPWLADVGDWLAALPEGPDGGGVTACSALKCAYRDVLRAARPEVVFVLLHADRGLLKQRLSARSGHFMPMSLLDSQLDTLEPFGPGDPGVEVDVAGSADDVVDRVVAALGSA